MMLERILIPLDGSPRAEAILAQIRPLLLFRGGEVTLIRAVPLIPSLRGVDQTTFLRESREEADDYLARVSEVLVQTGVRVKTLTCQGAPAGVILDGAVREGSTLIAMTSHGRTGLDRWHLGSVAEKVVQASRVPVLVIPSFLPGSSGELGVAEIPFRKILIPADGSEASLGVVDPAIDLARSYGAEVVLLHVQEYGPDTARGLCDAAARVAERFTQRGVTVRLLTVAGDPASQIVDLARQERADLVAMATHGHSGATRWVLGSVTEKVLRTVHLPMLVVRSGSSPERSGS